MSEDAFTLHRQIWRRFRMLPRPGQIWIAVAIAALLIFEVPSLLSGASEEQHVRDAVALAIDDATGPDPASGCTVLSAAGLSQVAGQFGSAFGPRPVGESPLGTCQRLVVQVRGEATAQQMTDLRRGTIRAVAFQADGSAVVLYVAADHRIGVNVALSEHDGRWLIDRVGVGSVVSADSGNANDRP